MECSEYRGGRIVSSDSELLTPPARAARYETLMRVSRAIGAHQNASGLCTALVDELNGVVDFDAIGVFLKCPNSDRFQNHFVHMESRSVLVAEEKLSPEETFVSSVYERQESWLRSTDELEPRHERLQAALQNRGIRSICALPLTTVHRRVGGHFLRQQASRCLPARRGQVHFPGCGPDCAGFR